MSANSSSTDPGDVLAAVGFRQLLDKLPGITVAVFDTDLRFVFLGGRGMAGLRLPDYVGRTLWEVWPERNPIHDAYERALGGSASQFEVTTLQGRAVIAYCAPLHDPAGQIVGGVSVSIDVTDQKAEEDQLRAWAFKDPLTGLTNRRLFTDRLEMAVAQVNRERRRRLAALVVLDLDGFKGVNDRLGHAAGDEILLEVASRLECVTRVADTCARIGGDEFAVLTEPVDPEEVDIITTRLREVLDQPYTAEGQPADVGVSLGVVMVTAAMDAPALLEAADGAMYADKARRKAAR